MVLLFGGWGAYYTLFNTTVHLIVAKNITDNPSFRKKNRAW